MAKDLFDSALVSECSIWKKGSGTFDGYGIETQVLTLLVEGVKCRMDYGSGKELDAGAVFGVQTCTFFMRPVLIDSPPIPLNIHHWIQLNVENGVTKIDPPDANAQMFDIQNIKNLAGHHLEVETKLIEP
jgi:hypothetical protein